MHQLNQIHFAVITNIFSFEKVAYTICTYMFPTFIIEFVYSIVDNRTSIKSIFISGNNLFYFV